MSLDNGKVQLTQSEIVKRNKRNRIIWTTIKIVLFIIFITTVIIVGGK